MPFSRHRTWLLDLARTAGDRCFDPATNRCLISRDTYWYAISLLFDRAEERQQFGRQLLATLPVEDATHSPATLLAVLCRLPEKLTPALSLRLEEAVRASLPEAAMVELRDGNVNHPLAACATLILGGERLGEQWATEVGTRRLAAFRGRIGDHRSRFRRQAEMSEYNSLTYTALDLWFLALIAEHSRSEDARALALFLEERLWVSVAMHFHAPTQQFAGPHSRSYQEDSLGGFSGLHCTMLAAFDNPLFLEPALCDWYDHPSALLQNALAAILAYHVPAEARAIAWKKPFPYAFRMTTYGECYHENSRRGTIEEARSLKAPFSFDDEIYPGGWSDLTTYMTEEYALGSSALPYVNAGHSDCVMLRMRRSDQIASMADFRSAYTRGVFNGATVGGPNFSHVARAPVDSSYLYEEGRSAVYQHQGTAIVCYCPKRAGHEGVSQFRLDLIFGYHAPFDELLVDDFPVQDFPFEAGPGALICFRDHRTYGMVRPLPLVPAASERPIRLWRTDGFLLVSFINYEGPPRDLSRHEINGWRSGFVLELRTATKSSWEEFLVHARNTRVTDTVTDGSVRSVSYGSGRNAMAFSFDPYKEVVLSRRWNGTEEHLEHMDVAAEGRHTGPYCPPSLYGKEMIR